MPPALYTQSVIAVVWDFDKTLSTGYMQDPLFDRYGVDKSVFWGEVNGLVDYYKDRGLQVSKDTAYLGHILTYVADGIFADLTNETLRELGAEVPLAPGIPDFLIRCRYEIEFNERYHKHDVKVEHYVVSTGLRQMIMGSSVAEHVNGVWACELITDPPPAGYLSSTEVMPDTGRLAQVGYIIDNTTKTRALFEINKGSNQTDVDVNAKVREEDRRVPFTHMIYVADGPSDVPCFSVLNQYGGKTLGVYQASEERHYEGVAGLLEQGRINHMAEADYTKGKPADKWMMRALHQIANEICDTRDRTVSGFSGAPGHVVSNS